MDIFQDLLEDPLDGVPPWEYNDSVKMGDAAPSPMDFEFPKETTISFPPHWGELMEQIRLREEEMKRVILSRRSAGESVSPASRSLGSSSDSMPVPIHSNPNSMLPPSGYALLPPLNTSQAHFQPPHVPYPHLPFWTAAPLPFSPGMYPVNVLPPNARESLLAPKAPPQPNVEVKKKKRPGRKPKTPGRPRDARGLFAKSPEAEAQEIEDDSGQQALVGKIQELQKQLLESRYESVILREQLVHSQIELSQLKDRGLVKSTIRGYQEQPVLVDVERAALGKGATSLGSSPPNSANPGDAFRVQLDYGELKSKLRPTNNGHYDLAADQPFHFVPLEDN